MSLRWEGRRMPMRASISLDRPAKCAKQSSLGAQASLSAGLTQSYFANEDMSRESKQAGMPALSGNAPRSNSPGHSRDQLQITPAELSAEDEHDHVGHGKGDELGYYQHLRRGIEEKGRAVNDSGAGRNSQGGRKRHQGPEPSPQVRAGQGGSCQHRDGSRGCRSDESLRGN